MTCSSGNGGYLTELEGPLSASMPGTEVDMSPSSPGAHSFQSPLLDDIQLDLELECEEDGVAFPIRDKNYHTWNAGDSPSHLSLPVDNPTNENEFLSCENERTNLTNTSFNQSTPIDQKEREDLTSRKESFSCGKRFLNANLSTNNFETGSCKLDAPSMLCDNEIMTTHSLSAPNSCQNSSAVCPLCRILFSSFNSLQLHFSEQHSRIKIETESHQCSTCGKCYSCKKNLVKHAKTHSIARSHKPVQAGPFQCHICPYVGSKKVLLEQHLKTQHNPKRETFSCNLCSFFCVQERSYKVHLLTHEGTEGKFACDQCGKLFFTMKILKRHALTHNTSRPYVCDFENCKKAFTIKSRLTDHIRTVHEKYFTESQSKNRAPVSQDDNLQHNEIMFPTEDPATTILGNKIEDSDNFVIFEEAAPIDPLTCKAENPKNELDENERSQNNENVFHVYDIILPQTMQSAIDSENKVYKPNSKSHGEYVMKTKTLSYGGPNLSGSEIKSTSCLMKSKRNHKNFQCSWKGCCKSFRDGYNLRKHMSTHTGEMDIACPLCRYRCVQKSALEKHMKTHIPSRQSKIFHNLMV